MTYAKIMKLYKHYKNNYDFQLKNVTYAELDDYKLHDGEFIKD